MNSVVHCRTAWPIEEGSGSASLREARIWGRRELGSEEERHPASIIHLFQATTATQAAATAHV